LLVVFDSAYVLALAAWAGSILFFSFGVAPVLFPVLGPEAGGRFVRALFPRYYAWGAISGAIALPAFVAVPLSFPEYRSPRVAVQALLILAGILIMLYAGNTLTPAINAARDAGPAGQPRFERLHRRAVRLNALVLVLSVGLLVAHTARPAARTAGTVELTPQERARYDAELARVISAIELRQAQRLPLDEATIRELVAIYARRRRPPAALAPAPPGPSGPPADAVPRAAPK
jgi:hypothetical protein